MLISMARVEVSSFAHGKPWQTADLAISGAGDCSRKGANGVGLIYNGKYMAVLLQVVKGCREA